MDYYKILEITEEASPEVVKAAYKALAKKYHPDVYNGTEAECKKRMADINEAYDVLSDVSKRRIYDMQRGRQEFSKKGYTKADCKEGESWDEKSDFQNKSGASPSEEQPNSVTGKKGFFSRIISDIGKEIVTTVQNNNREMDNAFLEGMSMDEGNLIIRFKKSTGYKRLGYSKALESKGVLEKNSEGQLVPTYRFKYYF